MIRITNGDYIIETDSTDQARWLLIQFGLMKIGLISRPENLNKIPKKSKRKYVLTRPRKSWTKDEMAILFQSISMGMATDIIASNVFLLRNHTAAAISQMLYNIKNIKIADHKVSKEVGDMIKEWHIKHPEASKRLEVKHL